MFINVIYKNINMSESPQSHFQPGGFLPESKHKPCTRSGLTHHEHDAKD